MELTKSSTLIDSQKEKVFSSTPKFKLKRPCRLDDGVIRHSEFEKNRYKILFEKSESQICFFIPASGFGSRMFKFLYEFLIEPDEESRSQTERFLNSIESFAFFELLPYQLKKRVREYDIDLDSLVSYILNPEGLGLGALPKGLIPFHRSRSFILNAFQEHIIQGLNIMEDNLSFHFTINKDYQDKIESSINSVCLLTGRKCNVEWSEQDPSTHSVVFDEDKNVVKDEEGNTVARPSGHGALLENLNTIHSDIIFIKNIDNVQHESYSSLSIDTLKYIGGVLDTLKEEFTKVMKSNTPRESIALLNQQYQFACKTTNFDEFTDEELRRFIYRPIRVCGMIHNEGQPGGGPFWESKDGVLTKQIVEKSQISNNEEQSRLMVQGQYFNPVLMAISTKDIDGKKLDLNNFVDDSKYFIVKKPHFGKEILYMERPGLWNGGMSDWISVFVEIPSEVFTPVKNVLDLLNKAHLESI